MSKNSILSEIQFDEDSGKLSFKGMRYLLIRPETIIGFQKAIEGVFGEPGGELLYIGGFEGGSRSAQKLKELFNLKPKAVVEKMCRMGTEIGWGRFNLKSFNMKLQKLSIEVKSSPFAEAYGTSQKSVCHFIRGVIAGIASIVFTPLDSKHLTGFTDKIEVIEKRCLSQGFQSCIFITKRSK